MTWREVNDDNRQEIADIVRGNARLFVGQTARVRGSLSGRSGFAVFSIRSIVCDDKHVYVFPSDGPCITISENGSDAITGIDWPECLSFVPQITRVYLSAPFGGCETNIGNAIEWLAWAQEHTAWGLGVQAPWLASAQAGLLPLRYRATEKDWVTRGGIEVERATLDTYHAVLCVGRDSDSLSPGQLREAMYMHGLNRDVYIVERRYAESATSANVEKWLPQTGDDNE